MIYGKLNYINGNDENFYFISVGSKFHYWYEYEFHLSDLFEIN